MSSSITIGVYELLDTRNVIEVAVRADDHIRSEAIRVDWLTVICFHRTFLEKVSKPGVFGCQLSILGMPLLIQT